MVIHREDTLVTQLTVRSASWFYLFALAAISIPDCFKVIRSLVSVFHHRLDLTRDAFEPP